MSDILDKADEAAEVFLQAALSHKQPAPPSHGVGFCINCGVGLEGDARWCDVECRNDWERNANSRR